MVEEKREFGPYPGRATRELISEYTALKNIVSEYTKRKEPLPLVIQAQLPKLKALQSSLARMGIKI